MLIWPPGDGPTTHLPGARQRITVVGGDTELGGVLVLPGGRPRSDAVSRPWQLANQRMMWLAWSLRRRLGRPVQVRRVQYRKRGWNSPGLDAVCDADAALSRLRHDVGSDDLVLVGHSMGFQTTWARDRGVDARWVGLPDAGHHLVREFSEWHRLTSEFVAQQLQVANIDAVNDEGPTQ